MFYLTKADLAYMHEQATDTRRRNARLSTAAGSTVPSERSQEGEPTLPNPRTCSSLRSAV